MDEGFASGGQDMVERRGRNELERVLVRARLETGSSRWQEREYYFAITRLGGRFGEWVGHFMAESLY